MARSKARSWIRTATVLIALAIRTTSTPLYLPDNRLTRPVNGLNMTDAHITYYSLPACVGGELSTSRIDLRRMYDEGGFEKCRLNPYGTPDQTATARPNPVWSVRLWTPRGELWPPEPRPAVLDTMKHTTWVIPFTTGDCDRREIPANFKWEGEHRCMTLGRRGDMLSFMLPKIERIPMHAGSTVIRREQGGPIKLTYKWPEDDWRPSPHKAEPICEHHAPWFECSFIPSDKTQKTPYGGYTIPGADPPGYGFWRTLMRHEIPGF